jgi:hypothetical protein
LSHLTHLVKPSQTTKYPRSAATDKEARILCGINFYPSKNFLGEVTKPRAARIPSLSESLHPFAVVWCGAFSNDDFFEIPQEIC